MTEQRLPHGVERIAATVRGDVQGVGFRWFVVQEAARLGLVGWVANAPDGTVRLEAEGPGTALARLIERLRHGPPGAIVGGVSTSALRPMGNEPRFAVRSLAHRGD